MRLAERVSRTLRLRSMNPTDRIRIPFFQDWEGSGEFDEARMRWLVALRWLAIVSMVVPIVAAVEGFIPGIHHRLLIGVTIFATLFNGLVQYVVLRYGWLAGRQFALLQAMIDLGMLTAVLYGTGGIYSPFLGYYVFHVALVAVLSGPRAALGAGFMAVLGAGFLILCEFVPLGAATWDPPRPWGTITQAVAFVGLLLGTAYIAGHAARERWLRERDLMRARDRAALDYQLLSNTLDELDAGLEVVDDSGRVVFANRRAEALSSMPDGGGRVSCPGQGRCEHIDGDDVCPIVRAFAEGVPGRCRFAHGSGRSEQIYERLTFPLAAAQGERARVMNLYVDRSDAAIGERKLVMTERLVSLGRIAQGVAHELNTPLATIRTLATDMRDALAGLENDPSPETRKDVVDDLDESADLIREETIRLGRITHALLAGGDLARARVEKGVNLVAVVERARALVVAGLRGSIRVNVDPSVATVKTDVDPDRLMQVLVNLLQNSIDAMRTGGGTLARIHASAEGESVRLVVEDDGPGLEPDIRDRLFEPFATTKPPGEGTGLGLYASFMLVRSMGGELAFEEPLEKGARAVVRLPKAKAPVPLAEAPEVSQRL